MKKASYTAAPRLQSAIAVEHLFRSSPCQQSGIASVACQADFLLASERGLLGTERDIVQSWQFGEMYNFASAHGEWHRQMVLE